jgi:argininosuccinate synthase
MAADRTRREVVTFTADLGQGEELEPARKKAEMLGIKEIFIEDVREEFVRDFVFPMFRANAVYEGVYLLGTSIARPLISKHLDRDRRQDRRRRHRPRRDRQGQRPGPLRALGLCAEPDIKIIAPWRDWSFKSRTDLSTSPKSTRSRSPRTRRAKRRSRSTPTCCTRPPRAKCWKIRQSRRRNMCIMRTISPMAAPDKATEIKVGFEKGDAVSINGKRMSPATLLARSTIYGRDNGIGRLDLVENRFVGMKSRGVYETPGGTILLAAHRAIESITLDRGAAHLKDELMPRYAELIYYGFWFSPEREMLQALIDKSQERTSRAK